MEVIVCRVQEEKHAKKNEILQYALENAFKNANITIL